MKVKPDLWEDAKAISAATGRWKMALHLHIPLHDAQVQLAADVADKLSQFSTPTFCLGCSYNRLWWHPLMLILSKMFHRPFSSVVCTVVMIYCIVIIYLPSMVEAETNFIVSVITIIALSYLLSSLSFFLAGEITQVLESIPWIRCASGNVSSSQSSFWAFI